MEIGDFHFRLSLSKVGALHKNQKVTHVKGKDLDRQLCPIVNVREQGASKVLKKKKKKTCFSCNKENYRHIMNDCIKYHK